MCKTLVLFSLLVTAVWPLSQANLADTSCFAVDDIDTVQRQWNSFWRADNAGNVKIVLGREYMKRVSEKSERLRMLIKSLLGDDIDSLWARLFTLNTMTNMDTLINLLNNPEAAMYQFRHTMKAYADFETTAEDGAESAKILIEVCTEAMADVDQRAWNGLLNTLNDLYYNALRRELRDEKSV